MAVTNYLTVDGTIRSETTGGVRTNYIPDGLGSVVATTNEAGVVQNTYRYKPYGSLLAKTGVAEDPNFLWVGQWGYRNSSTSSLTYVRARHYLHAEACWTSSDPLWPDQSPYLYVKVSPTVYVDPTGTSGTPPSPKNCKIYKDLCDEGYIFACNSYYACLNAGDSNDANCMRKCLQRRLRNRIRKGKPLTCGDWINDHLKCMKGGGECNYWNPCTNSVTLRLLCNNLFNPEATFWYLGFNVKCAKLLEIFCSWPTPYPQSCKPPKGTEWQGVGNGGPYPIEEIFKDINKDIIPVGTIGTHGDIIKNCLTYTIAIK